MAKSKGPKIDSYSRLKVGDVIKLEIPKSFPITVEGECKEIKANKKITQEDVISQAIEDSILAPELQMRIIVPSG